MSTTNSSCDPAYNEYLENLKYAFQFAYLVPGVFIHSRILAILFWQQRRLYMAQSFFVIFSMDSITSLTQILIDVSIARLTIYVPQVCPLLFEHFAEHTSLPHAYYTLYSYMRAAKSVIQVFATTNRMTCVLMPLKYGQMWRRWLPVCIAVIVLSPLLIVWNVLISDTFPAPIFGGFTLGYTRRVRWASLSLFQMSLMLGSLAVTLVTSGVTLCRMRRLENRLKATERALCFASFYISGGFLLAAIFQSYFAFFNLAAASTDLIYFLQGLAFDVLNVGSPIVMVVVSGQLRYHFMPTRAAAPKVSIVVSVTSLSKV